MRIKDFLKRKEELYWAKQQASKNDRENATTENWRAWNKAIDDYNATYTNYCAGTPGKGWIGTSGNG